MKRLGIIILSFVILGCMQESNPTIQSNNFEIIKMADGVYGVVHKLGGKAICNVGIVDNGKETIIFDSFLSPEVAAELLLAIKKLNLSPVTYLINSHYHNDHIRGNQVFPDGIEIISTERTAALIAEKEPLEIADEQTYAPQRFAYFDSLYKNFDGDTTSEAYRDILMWRPYFEVLSKSQVEIKTRLPKSFVQAEKHLDGPKRRVQLITKGAGHTESDLVLYLPDDKILFAADLIFNKCHPYVANGSLKGLTNWLDYLETLEILKILPGHGNIGKKELVDQMKQYLIDLKSTAQTILDSEQTPEQVNQVEMPATYKDWWFGNFYATNVKFALQEASVE